MRAGNPAFSRSCCPINQINGDIHQNYQSFKNETIFITTSNTFQEAHSYNLNLIEDFKYKIDWFCIWDSKKKEESHIEIKVILDYLIELPYEKINEILVGIIYGVMIIHLLIYKLGFDWMIV